MSLRRALVFIALVSLFPLQWFGMLGFGGHAGHVVHAISAGAAIFGAAFLLSWAAEAGQVDIPQALALAFLALVAVLPEYAVDLYFAYTAGSQPEYAPFATANMTGANRLLIGLGWPAVVAALWLGRRGHAIELDRNQMLELTCLAVATLYAFVVAWKGSLGLVDAIVLLALFVYYMVSAARSAHEEVDLDGVPEALATGLSTMARRAAVIGMFLFAGLTILSAAEPFAESLLGIGRQFGVEEFLLVQWLAPLASESPEFIVAIIFALSGKARAGLRALLSSKVNQWTLLVGMLPIAYALGGAGMQPLRFDARQVEEVFLTAAQSLFALTVLANFRFTLAEAGMLAVLFLAQLFSTDPEHRTWFCWAYVGLAGLLLAWSPEHRRGMADILAQRRPTPEVDRA
jgi:cation:H+ antiporter